MSLRKCPVGRARSPVIFFDIDGTLLRVEDSRTILSDVFERHHDIPSAFRGVPFAGRTDPQILNEVLKKHALDLDSAEREDFFHSYYRRLEQRIGDSFRLLPGVTPLLDQLASGPVRLGIATGNNFPSARIKLRAAGLESHFQGGGFGEDGPSRSRVVQTALRRFGVSGPHCVVIGDSVHDVRCGREHGARTVAVSTGYTSEAELKNENPDLFLPGLEAPRAFWQFLNRHFPSRVN